MSLPTPSGGTGREPHDAASTPGHDGRDYSGGLVGHKDRALDVSASPQPGTTHADPGREDDDDNVPIGSALAAQDAGTGDPDEATLGTTAGGERASAGRADADRNSRDHGNSLDV